MLSYLSRDPRPLRALLFFPLFFFVMIALAAPAAGQGGAGEGHSDMTWSALAGDETLAGHVAVLDGRGGMLLIGGEADLGAPPRSLRRMDLESGEWTDFAVSGDLPAPRTAGRGLVGARAIVDPEEALLVMVCDCSEGSTYALDLNTGLWTRVDSEPGLELWYPSFVYDAERDRGLLVGGDLFGTNTLVSAVWTLDLSAARGGWTSQPDAPFVLLHQAAAIAPATGHLVLIGGQNAEGVAVDDSWRLDLGSISEAGAWQRLPLPTDLPAPVSRIGASLVFEAAGDTALLYGGYRPLGESAAELADVWRLSHGTDSPPRWTLLASDQPAEETPGARAGHSAIWDDAGTRMIVYGGVHEEDGLLHYLDDAWQFAPKIEPPNPPIYLPSLQKP
jgi:hypothetical protein